MWQEILAVVIPILLAALAAASPIIITWLKSQKVVQQLHLEDLLATMVPQVVEWVEWWAENLVKEGKGKPLSAEKLAKAKDLLMQKMPSIVGNPEELRMRIETALREGGFFDEELVKEEEKKQ